MAMQIFKIKYAKQQARAHVKTAFQFKLFKKEVTILISAHYRKMF